MLAMRDMGIGRANMRRRGIMGVASSSIAADAVGFFALTVLALMAHCNRSLSRTSSRHLVASTLVAMLAIAAEVGCIAFESEGFGGVSLYVACNVVGFAASPAIGYLLGLSVDQRHGSNLVVLIAPLVVNAALVALSPTLGLTFSVDAGGSYARRGYYWVFVLTYLVGIAFYAWRLLSRTSASSGRWPLTLGIIAYLIAGTSVQIAIPEVHVSWLCISFVLVLTYAYACEEGETTDALTGLLNHSVYENDLLRVASEPAMLLVFDVDDFKLVNDTFGHRFGDETLRDVAVALETSFRRIGSCYRIGGDEFCVIAPHAPAEATERARRSFVEYLGRMRTRDERLPTVSMGCSSYDGGGDVTGALEQADAEMYLFKNSRRKARVLE